MTNLDMFAVDLDRLEEIYLRITKEAREQAAREEQAYRCHLNTCHHDKYFRNGKRAVKKDGSPDQRGTCREGFGIWSESLSHQYETLVDLTDFFKEINLHLREERASTEPLK